MSKVSNGATSERTGWSLRTHPAAQQLLVLLAIVALWQLLSGPVINAYYVSTPKAVLSQIASWIADGSLWQHLAATLITTLVGFGIAVGIAIPLALVSRYVTERRQMAA